MRITLMALVATLAVSGGAVAQNVKSASQATIEANRHYADGWSAIRTDSWDAAAREFQQAIDVQPRFALAYYSLGRAEMGRRNFAAAITAYTKCRSLYETDGGEQFGNQLDMRQRLTDRIFEYQTELNQANARASLNARGSTQSQSLYVRELEAQIRRLEQARDRSTNITVDVSVPYFVPMALGAAYFRSGRFADAEREYKAAIAANAGSGETFNNLAVLYLTTGRPDEADQAVKAAEKTGFRVHEELKGDIKKAKRAGS
jgi:tetratricopeptide (TPR) repeat protein